MVSNFAHQTKTNLYIIKYLNVPLGNLVNYFGSHGFNSHLVAFQRCTNRHLFLPSAVPPLLYDVLTLSMRTKDNKAMFVDKSSNMYPCIKFLE